MLNHNCDYLSLAINYDSIAVVSDSSCIYPIPRCLDSLAINYYSDPDYVDNDLCIYDLCTDYLESTDFDCSFNANPPYDIDDQLGCETLEAEFSLCYPEDCETTFKFSDFEDKIIWIIYEADW